MLSQYQGTFNNESVAMNLVTMNLVPTIDTGNTSANKTED